MSREIKKKDIESFRRERVEELRLLHQVVSESKINKLSVERYGFEICPNTTPIISAADICAQSNPKIPEVWSYDLNSLLFQITRPRNTIPSTVGETLSLKLSVLLKGIIIPENGDIFKTLFVNIEIYDAAPLECKNHCEWHLDRCDYDFAKRDSKESHPLYHFQYGGKSMRDIGDKVGRVLLLNPPRLPHAPMDALLAFDFVLSNFAGYAWEILRNNSTYKTIIKKAQQLYWKPYFKSITNRLNISGSWANDLKEGKLFDLLPTLLQP